FVNAVRGQRTNTGCIANGRGTAWAAVLGATSDIGSGDVDLKGAAVGADMKVGEKSSLGVAFGYIDGDAKIPGMSKAEQEGTYVALYGEHGLRKLSATSCLSLDWVAAYGQTDTEWESADWEQQSLQLNTRLNWNKKVTDRLCMSVFGGLEYFTSESDRVENAKTGSIQNLRGEIGVGARYVAWGTPGSEAVTDEKGATIAAARPGCEKLVLHGEIRYMNDMVRSNPVIEQDGIRDGGDNPGRQGMGIEAGATYRISERWSASANYGFNTMEDSKEHRVNVGASYTF
ncbi:MAG: autotransporter outer membrane beta-barrel domain-containing protein, partial [Akkermansia sp.]|nr:autotransporter outer membrane beta-barrel domain-containing protein [Akkermansia sp.]